MFFLNFTTNATTPKCKNIVWPSLHTIIWACQMFKYICHRNRNTPFFRLRSRLVWLWEGMLQGVHWPCVLAQGQGNVLQDGRAPPHVHQQGGPCFPAEGDHVLKSEQGFCPHLLGRGERRQREEVAKPGWDGWEQDVMVQVHWDNSPRCSWLLRVHPVCGQARFVHLPIQ